MSHSSQRAGVYSAGDDWIEILAAGVHLFFSLACSDSVRAPISLPQLSQQHIYARRTPSGHTMDQTAYPRSTGNGNVNCNNVTNSHNNTVNVNNIVADEIREIMQWLSPLNPRGRHHDVRTDRVDGVGNWLLETNEFREWRSSEGGTDKAVLFCSGGPGVGKTYLR